MINHKFIKWVASVVFIFGMFNNSYSTTVEKLSLKQLTENSTDIITAKVKSVVAYKEEGVNRIYSDIELEITDVIKGKTVKNTTIKITRFGGTVDGITMRAIGMPIYRIGEEALLFYREGKV